MIKCVIVRDLLSAYLDSELDDATRAEVAAHLDDCRECRKELRTLKETVRQLQGEFSAWIDEAPPISHRVKERSEIPPLPPEGVRRKRSILMKTLTGIAALVLLTTGIYFFPGSKVNASPAELIQRASGKYLNWDDVELQVGIHFKPLEFLSLLSDDNDDEAARESGALLLRIVLQSPNRFLFEPITGKGKKVTPGDRPVTPEDRQFTPEDRPAGGLSGFDGERFWSYDEEKDAVTVSHSEIEGDTITITYITENTKTKNTFPKDTDLLRFLSWDYMEELNNSGEYLIIEEITGPYDNRVGRRVFELGLNEEAQEQKEKEKEDGSFWEKIIWTTSRITINPEDNLVERYELDFKVAFISMLTLKVEVVDVDQGMSESFFHYSSHLREDIPVIQSADNPDLKVVIDVDEEE